MNTSQTTSELLAQTYGTIPASIPDDVKNMINADKLNGVRENLNELLPDYADSYRFNTLKRLPEYSLTSDKFISIPDSDFNLFHMTLRKATVALGLPNLSQADSRCIYEYMLDLNRVDPFDEYIHTIKWDGVHRLRRWFIEGLDVSIPSLSKEDSDFVIGEATQAWFMGAVQRNSEHDPVSLEIVPILMSKKQGIGKTTYVEYTSLRMVEDSWYNIPKKDFDDEKDFFESISGAKIIEWGEATVLKRPDKVEELKAFITKDKDTYRNSYGRNAATYARQWVSIMTTNESALFYDSTGNRRFVPMVCGEGARKRDITRTNMRDHQYEAEQVWAEAVFLSEIEHKRPCMDERAEELIAKCQKAFAKGNDFYDEVLQRIDDRLPNLEDKMPVAEVKRIIADVKYTYSEMKNRTIDANDIISYAGSEFKLDTCHVWVGEGESRRRTMMKCLIRVAPSPRIVSPFESDEVNVNTVVRTSGLM